MQTINPSKTTHVIRVIYSDTDGDYEIALIVAGMDLTKR